MSSTIDGQAGAGDKAGRRRGQKGNGARHLVHLSRASQGVRLLGALEEGGKLLISQSGLLLNARGDDARIHRIHADALGRQLHGGAGGQLIQRRLGDAVREHARKGAQPIHRADVDDVSYQEKNGKRKVFSITVKTYQALPFHLPLLAIRLGTVSIISW